MRSDVLSGGKVDGRGFTSVARGLLLLRLLLVRRFLKGEIVG